MIQFNFSPNKKNHQATWAALPGSSQGGACVQPFGETIRAQRAAIGVGRKGRGQVGGMDRCMLYRKMGMGEG